MTDFPNELPSVEKIRSLSSPLWLAHINAMFFGVKPSACGPPASMNGSACNAFKVERVKVTQCGSPAEATTPPALE